MIEDLTIRKLAPKTQQGYIRQVQGGAERGLWSGSARRRGDFAGSQRKQGPIQFLENNPLQSSFWLRFMCPKTGRN